MAPFDNDLTQDPPLPRDPTRTPTADEATRAAVVLSDYARSSTERQLRVCEPADDLPARILRMRAADGAVWIEEAVLAADCDQVEIASLLEAHAAGSGVMAIALALTVWVSHEAYQSGGRPSESDDRKEWMVVSATLPDGRELAHRAELLRSKASAPRVTAWEPLDGLPALFSNAAVRGLSRRPKPAER